MRLTYNLNYAILLIYSKNSSKLSLIKTMRIKQIKYFTPQDLNKGYLDVVVFLKDEYCTNGYYYVVEVTTPQATLDFMERTKCNFIEPDYPVIMVSKLTNEIIKAAIQSFIDSEEDAFWLKLYHIAGSLTIEEINEILSRKKQEKITEINSDSDLN